MSTSPCSVHHERTYTQMNCLILRVDHLEAEELFGQYDKVFLRDHLGRQDALPNVAFVLRNEVVRRIGHQKEIDDLGIGR